MTIERAELQDAARKAFGEDGLKPAADKIWSLVTEMGWPAMAVPEDLGGLGLGQEALGVAYTELGRVLAPAPVLAHLLVIDALTQADTLTERQSLLESAIGGEVMTTSLTFSTVGPDLSGTLHSVPDADKASHILVFTTGDARCVLVPTDAPGVSITERATWDETRRLFDVTLDGVEPGKTFELAGDNVATELAARLKAHLLFAIAGDSLGGAEAALEMTIDYLKTRRQFDRPLALFQSLKHRCADMKTQLAASEALFWLHADGSGEDSLLDPVNAAGAVKAHATRVFQHITEEAIQLHGGIGLTEEHQCHLFMKRAMLNLSLGGSADQWDEAVGRALLAAL